MILFDVDIRRLGLQLLPMCLRKPLMGALVYAVTQPAASELKTLLRYRRDVNEEMKRNGQTCNLRRMLNDLFDPVRRGITIMETTRATGVTLSLRSDGKPLTTPQTLNSRGYGGSTDMDFAVRLPARLKGVVDESQLNSLVRRYKLSGMRFGLEYTGLYVNNDTRKLTIDVLFEEIAGIREHSDIMVLVTDKRHELMV